jgi:hypothetical protein
VKTICIRPKAYKQTHYWQLQQQYDEVDEIKETRNIGFNFSLDLSDIYFGSGKYPTLEKI